MEQCPFHFTGFHLTFSQFFLSIQPVVSMQFLGDEETVKKAIESVANQGKAK